MEAFRFPVVFYFILFYTLIAKIYMWLHPWGSKISRPCG